MIYGIEISHVLIVSTLMFFIGIYGFITRRNMITILMSVELVLNSVVINFVIFNKYLFPESLDGQMYGLFMIAVAAAEVALAMAIIIDLYRLIKSIDVDMSRFPHSIQIAVSINKDCVFAQGIFTLMVDRLRDRA